MRTMTAAGMLAVASLGVRLAGAPAASPSLQETPPPAKPAAKPAPVKPAPTQPVPAAGGSSASMEAPKLPPFAGEIVNFDRRGPRVVACVDRN
jgi:hypothetical protein